MPALRCPRCKSDVDASASKPGSIIKCSHCRGDMRVPDAPKDGGAGRAGGGRQSTLFRRMSNASVPGQKGHSSGGPVGPGDPRGASGRGKDMSTLYTGLGIGGLVVVVVVVGLMMKGKGAEPGTPSGPKKVTKAPIATPPPPPVAPAPVVETPKPNEKNTGPPTSWEPDAMSYVLESVRPVSAVSAHEKEAMDLIRTKNTAKILAAPFKLLPFVINTLVSEDRELARNCFQILYEFGDDRKEYDSKGKNLIDMAWVNDAEYRGYTYSWWSTKWWPERASKLPDAPGNQEAVNKIDWIDMLRQLRGGAYHDESTPQGTAYRRVKNLGRAAWVKLAEMVDDEELGRTAAQVLIELTKEKKPLPTEQNRAEVKAAWIAWINQQK